MTQHGGSEWDPMTLAKTHRHREFVRFLQVIEDMTEDDLREALEACPAHIVAQLAHGPKPHRYACGICDTFGKAFYTGTPDSTDPMWRAWGYHEVPKRQMRCADDRHYGPHANATYERCIATYQAAGWIGEAVEANA